MGAGVGASLGALSLAILVLYLNERRRRKRIERSALGMGKQHGEIPDHYAMGDKATSTPPYEQAPQELESERLNELGPRY